MDLYKLNVAQELERAAENIQAFKEERGIGRDVDDTL